APFVLVPLFGSCAVALIYRYRRVSDATQRAQLKWVVLAIALRFAYNVLLFALGPLRDNLAAYAVTMLISYVIAAALPVAIAIAVVRHRLFDVDVVIS